MRSKSLRTGFAALALVVLSAPGARSEEFRPALRFGTLWFLSGQHLSSGGDASDEFVIKRGHLDFFLDLSGSVTARVTPDLTTGPDGGVEIPIKFAYLELRRPRVGPLAAAFVQAGRVPTPWIGFEEGIDRYRMQDGTFMDRLGFFASADEGLAVGGLFGSGLPETYLAHVRPSFPGRWGSFALGVYSGSGFKAPDHNDGYVLQGRASLRPLPDRLPGLQFSLLGVEGAGNTETEPDWTVRAAMASFEAVHLAATLQWTENHGAQSGAWVDDSGQALPGRGWSAFVELRERPGPGWAATLRHDWYDQDSGREGARFTRTIAGVARHFKGASAALLDVEVQDFEEPDRDNVVRVQFTVQIKYAAPPVALRSP